MVYNVYNNKQSHVPEEIVKTAVKLLTIYSRSQSGRGLNQSLADISRVNGEHSMVNYYRCNYSTEQAC